jgi:hypothetical protein
MVQYKTIILLTVIGIVILFSGCIGNQQVGTPAPIPTSTPLPTSTPIPTSTVTATPLVTVTPLATLPKELASGALYVDARMKNPVYWAPEKYELVSLQVQIFNQQSAPLPITAQIVNSEQVLEEQTFILERQGSSYSFTNQKTHFINNTNVTLRVLIPGYQPVEYAFMEVNS